MSALFSFNQKRYALKSIKDQSFDSRFNALKSNIYKSNRIEWNIPIEMSKLFKMIEYPVRFALVRFGAALFGSVG